MKSLDFDFSKASLCLHGWSWKWLIYMGLLLGRIPLHWHPQLRIFIAISWSFQWLGSPLETSFLLFQCKSTEFLSDGPRSPYHPPLLARTHSATSGPSPVHSPSPTKLHTGRIFVLWILISKFIHFYVWIKWGDTCQLLRVVLGI